MSKIDLEKLFFPFKPGDKVKCIRALNYLQVGVEYEVVTVTDTNTNLNGDGNRPRTITLTVKDDNGGWYDPVDYKNFEYTEISVDTVRQQLKMLSDAFETITDDKVDIKTLKKRLYSVIILKSLKEADNDIQTLKLLDSILESDTEV